MALPCMNCKALVEPVEAKVFAGVFVCPTCHQVAERLEQRATRELKDLLLLQREAIRIALVEGRLKLGPAEATRELTKKEVLEQVVELTSRVRKEPESNA